MSPAEAPDFEAAGRSARSAWPARLAAGLTLAVVALTLGGPLLSGDLWWHLSNGRWILNHGGLPGLDPFSHTGTNLPAETQEYGFQAGLAAIERAFGLVGLRVLGVLLGLGVLAVAWKTAARRLSPALAGAAVCLFAALFALKWELRPHLISALFVLALEALLFPALRADRLPPSAPSPLPSGRRCLLLFLLAALWIQLHAEALFAPIFAATAFGAALWTPWLQRPAQGSPWRRPAAYALAFLAALLGSLISPTFYDSHVYALFQRAVPERFIEEWFPSTVLPGDVRFAPVTLGLFAVFLGALGAGALAGLGQATRAFRKDAKALPLERLAFLALCLVLSIKARRFFWLAWFPALEALVWLDRRAIAQRWKNGLAGLLAWAALVALLFSSYVRLQAENLQRGAWTRSLDERLFPVEATRRLAEIDFQGNLFHPYEWGGYLGFWLWPGAKVFIDGRTVMFAEVIPERWLAERDPGYGAEVFAKRDVTAIVMKRLVERDGKLVAWRPEGADREWVRAYADRTAELWIRRDQTQALERLTARYRELGVPFDVDEGFVELAALLHNGNLQDQWGLLPREAYRQLCDAGLGLLALSHDPALIYLELAEAAGASRLGRSARYALGQALDCLSVDPAERAQILEAARGPGLQQEIDRLRLRLP